MNSVSALAEPQASEMLLGRAAGFVHDPVRWVDEDYDVILLDADCPDGMALKSILQALGAQVHLGPHTVEKASEPLILVHAGNRHRPDIAFRLDLARHAFPNALVGFITGDVVPAQVLTARDDVRDILGAAGIGLVCGPVSHGDHFRW
jgi:hypothetical protein